MPDESDETAVRQTPLIATLSPAASSEAMAVVTRSLKPAGVGVTSWTSPTASISPGNICFGQCSGPKCARGDLPQARERKAKPFEPSRPQHPWRAIYLDAIHEPGVPDPPMERHAPFHDQRRDAPRGQELESIRQPRLPRGRQGPRPRRDEWPG